ncbi:GNAT family protein [Hymenobacter tenuis]
MRNAIQPLSWDTDFLGFPVGQIRQESSAGLLPVQELVQQARQQGFRLLYWFVAPEDLVTSEALLAEGGVLADRKIRIALPLQAGQTQQLPLGIHAVTSFSPALQALAVQAGEHSRFRTDTRFAPEVSGRLYTEWLRKSLLGELAREVLLYQPNPAVPASGLLILGDKNHRFEMVLMAVEAAQRGQGIGAAFIEAARCRAAAWGHRTVQLVTQATNPAMRLYTREGFVLEHEEHVYHLWL